MPETLSEQALKSTKNFSVNLGSSLKSNVGREKLQFQTIENVPLSKQSV